MGNDATGDWQRDSSFGDVDQLAMTIHLMDPKWVGQAAAAAGPTATVNGYAPISQQPGQALFAKIS